MFITIKISLALKYYKCSIVIVLLLLVDINDILMYIKYVLDLHLIYWNKM